MLSVLHKIPMTLLPGFTEFIAKGNFYKQKYSSFKVSRKNDQAWIWDLIKNCTQFNSTT